MKYKPWGRNILMHSYFLHPGWRLSVVGHIERPLFGMNFRRQSQYTYCMNSPNSMQCSPKESVDHLRNGKHSPFDIRSSQHACSLILGWLRLTYSICQLSKFVSSTAIRTSGNNISILIEGHSGGGLVEENSMEHSGRTGHGYGVSILMWTPGGPKGAGQKRKHGQKRKSRDAELFPYFHTINRQELQQYHDIVFVDPNLQDTLYFMHINSS